MTVSLARVMNRKYRFLVPVLLMFAGACKPDGSASPEAETTDNAQALAPIEVQLVQPVSRQEFPALELIGEIRAQDTVKISSEIAGRVDGVPVEVGDRVAQGATLVEIDRETFRLRLAQATAEVAAAQAELTLAAKELERKRDLLSDNTISAAVYDQAEARHSLAAARLQATQAARDLAAHDVKRSLVQAPASGVISRRLTVPGEWAEVGQALLEMTIGDRIKVAARVPEAWAPRLGDLESFDFSVAGGAALRAHLYSIDPVVEGSSRSLELVGIASNPNRELRPGMFATVRLTSPRAITTLWLPHSTVVISSLPQVLMALDDKAVERRVQTGRRDGEQIEIISGLGPDELVIANIAGIHRGVPVLVAN